MKGVLGGSVSGRKLAGIEHALRLTDYATPFNAVVVLRIEGDFPDDRLPLALDQLQSRHPLLRACIRGENHAFSFYFDNAGPIPVEIDEPRTADDWLGAAEEELHRRFDLAAGPLMRCRYRPVPSGGHLIVTNGPGVGFGFGGAVITDASVAASPLPAGAWLWGGVYGHSWFVDPDRKLSVALLTNSSIEGMTGQLTVDVTAAIQADR